MLTEPSERMAQPHRPVFVVRGGPGRLSMASLREFWPFREVLWALLTRQVKVKYKQAAVGIGWAVLQPLLLAGLFALVLGRFAGIPSEGLPYLLFALTGLVAWTFFSSATSVAVESLVTDQSLLRKVYFPREMLPLAAVGAGLVDLVPGLLALLLVSIGYGIAPSITWLALPVPIITLTLLAAALGLALSGVNVYYRDVRYAVPFFIQVLLFASPVAYPLARVPQPWRTAYTVGNPAAAAIDGLRRIVLHHRFPTPLELGGALAWAAVLVVAGYAIFKRLERGFADRV